MHKLAVSLKTKRVRLLDIIVLNIPLYAEQLSYREFIGRFPGVVNVAVDVGTGVEKNLQYLILSHVGSLVDWAL